MLIAYRLAGFETVGESASGELLRAQGPGPPPLPSWVTLLSSGGADGPAELGPVV
jgi:hypothetical protein